MNICVYGAASTEIDELYIKIVEDLCENLAQRGHNLIYGAGACGLMGAAARGFKRGGGMIAGVAPEFFKESNVEALYKECNNIIHTTTMSTRKEIMEINADAFIVAPGGVGTLDEFFQVLTLKQLKKLDKPIALFNINGYYYSIEALMHNGVEERFMKPHCLELYKCFNENETDAMIEYIESGRHKED